MTVRELLGRIGSDELTEWLAFDDLEPLENGYLQAGIVASTIANVMGSGKKRFSPLDFMPGYRPKSPPKVTSDRGIAIMRGMARRTAAKANRI